MEYENKVLLAIMLAAYTIIVSLIGYKSRTSRTNEEYFLAARSLPAWLLSITFIASWWGGGSAIDLVDHANRDGLSTFWIYGVPVLIATALMFIFAKGIRIVATISQSELLEQRYDGRSAFMLTIFITIFMTIGAAIQVIVVGAFLQAFFGISYEMGAIIGTSLVAVYSLFGGFRGVVLTDLLQFVFFLFATIFLFIVAYNAFAAGGGAENFMERVATIRSTTYTDFTHNLSNNIAYIVTFGTSWMVQANVWQRISAAKSPTDARKMMAISFFVFIPLYLIVTLTGMLSILIYEDVPQGGIVSTMILSLKSPILGGVIFVGLCSAIMSTMDSMLNTGAMTLTVDIYKRHIKPNQTQRRYVLIGRISTLIISLAALLIGVKIRSVITISWIGADFIASGAFIPLVLAFLWRRATATAAFYSMIFGLTFSSYNLLIALGVDLPAAWEIASATQAIIGVCCSATIFTIVSLCTKPDYEKADKFIAKASVIKIDVVYDHKRDI